MLAVLVVAADSPQPRQSLRTSVFFLARVASLSFHVGRQRACAAGECLCQEGRACTGHAKEQWRRLSRRGVGEPYQALSRLIAPYCFPPESEQRSWPIPSVQKPPKLIAPCCDCPRPLRLPGSGRLAAAAAAAAAAAERAPESRPFTRAA